jgi:hypothetical protein
LRTCPEGFVHSTNLPGLADLVKEESMNPAGFIENCPQLQFEWPVMFTAFLH